MPELSGWLRIYDSHHTSVMLDLHVGIIYSTWGYLGVSTWIWYPLETNMAIFSTLLSQLLQLMNKSSPPRGDFLWFYLFIQPLVLGCTWGVGSNRRILWLSGQALPFSASSDDRLLRWCGNTWGMGDLVGKI